MIEPQAHLEPQHIAGFLSGSLSQEERAAALQHLDHCSECRAELIEVGGIAADARGFGRGRRLRRRLLPLALAAAASVAGLAIFRAGPVTTGPAVRDGEVPGASESLPMIGVIGPRDGEEVRDSVVLRWRPHGAGSYDVLLLSEDGRPLWSTTTEDTVVRIPFSEAVRPGQAYFWRVDAMGNGIVASTGVQRLTIGR